MEDNKTKDENPQHWVVLAFFVLVVTAMYWMKRPRSPRNEQPVKSRSHSVSVHKTQLLRCNISHARLFPEKHVFRHSYLAVGIPVRREQQKSWLLSVDTAASWWQQGWLHVTTRDHLHRGCAGATLSENLDAYLRDEVCRLLKAIKVITPARNR